MHVVTKAGSVTFQTVQLQKQFHIPFLCGEKARLELTKSTLLCVYMSYSRIQVTRSRVLVLNTLLFTNSTVNKVKACMQIRKETDVVEQEGE